MAAKKTTTQSTSVIDAKTLNNELEQEVVKKQALKKSIAQQYREETKITVTGSPMYRPYFGNNMIISLNGIPVYVPLDGQQYAIPESFAAVFFERISSIDEQIRMRNQMANVAENLESYAGEKSLISKR